MFFAIFLELYSNSRYNKGRGVFAILRYVESVESAVNKNSKNVEKVERLDYTRIKQFYYQGKLATGKI